MTRSKKLEIEAGLDLTIEDEMNRVLELMSKPDPEPVLEPTPEPEVDPQPEPEPEPMLAQELSFVEKLQALADAENAAFFAKLRKSNAPRRVTDDLDALNDVVVDDEPNRQPPPREANSHNRNTHYKEVSDADRELNVKKPKTTKYRATPILASPTLQSTLPQYEVPHVREKAMRVRRTKAILREAVIPPKELHPAGSKPVMKHQISTKPKLRHVRNFEKASTGISFITTVNK